MPDQFLPVASTAPPSAAAQPATVTVAAAVAELADALTDDVEPTNLRFGAVTAIESSADRRVQLDITGTAWLSRGGGVMPRVGDRVWVIQQGPVSLVGGLVNGPDSTPIGVFIPFAGSSSAVPTGWLACDGSEVSRTTYAALFAVIGTTYGSGDGSSTFNLPNLQNRVPVGSGSSYSRGTTGGAATVTLSQSQIPGHSHSFSGSTGGSGGHDHSVGNQGGRSDLLAGGGTNAAASGGGTTGWDGDHSHSFSGTTGGTGGGGSHENMPPFLAVPYIIKAL